MPEKIRHFFLCLLTPPATLGLYTRQNTVEAEYSKDAKTGDSSTYDIYHSQSHPVDLVLVFCLVLAEGRMAFEQFVQHTVEAEPVGARVVGRPFRQDFRRHVAVRTSAKKQNKQNPVD